MCTFTLQRVDILWLFLNTEGTLRFSKGASVLFCVFG